MEGEHTPVPEEEQSNYHIPEVSSVSEDLARESSQITVNDPEVQELIASGIETEDAIMRVRGKRAAEESH
ncbi:MAG: hypothetical protein WCI63_02440 [bacterium]